MQAYLGLTSPSSAAGRILQIRKESTGKEREEFGKTMPDKTQNFLLPTGQTSDSLGYSLLEAQDEGPGDHATLSSPH